MSIETAPAPRKPRKPAHLLTTIPATVVGSRWITPRMVRVTLQSDRLDGFIRRNAPDQFVTVIFPGPGQALIELTADFDWHYFYGLPDGVRPHARNYTVRFVDLRRGTIDIDVLVHGGPGLGELWAARALPGEAVYLWGPRIAYNPFPNAGFHLLFCDECGVPAAAATMDSLPSDAAGRLVAEVKHEWAVPPIPHRPNFAVDWLYSGDCEPGEGRLLRECIERSPVPDALVYAWGGGEMTSMRQIGRYLRKHWGLKTASISATGYWRAGASAED